MKRAGWIKRRTRMSTVPKPGSRSIVPPDVVEAVRLRDGGKCRRCGVWLANVPSGGQHHRLTRARGGKHTTANLVTLCLACHREVHTGDTVQAAQDGWLLPSGTDPAWVPILAPGGWMWLGTPPGGVVSQEVTR